VNTTTDLRRKAVPKTLYKFRTYGIFERRNRKSENLKQRSGLEETTPYWKNEKKSKKYIAAKSKTRARSIDFTISEVLFWHTISTEETQTIRVKDDSVVHGFIFVLDANTRVKNISIFLIILTVSMSSLETRAWQPSTNTIQKEARLGCSAAAHWSASTCNTVNTRTRTCKNEKPTQYTQKVPTVHSTLHNE
jgi:hypothetical protein